jgi:small-conductance mechanosensitive channel/CRP-like cAMP-binding protein
MKRLTLPLAISLVLAAVWLSLKIVASGVIGDGWFKYILALMLASLSVALVRLIDHFLFDILFVRRNQREAPALLRGLLASVLYLIAFLLIYRFVLQTSIGFEILATSTVISVILGLAMQDTLGNLFAGISLHIDQPFRILDAIKIGEVVGKVESVTWRTTTLRTNNNSLVSFPNSRVAREAVEVYPFNNLNRRVMQFPSPYSALPERVISLVRDSVASLPQVAPERTPVVRINSFSDSQITYEVLYWVKDYMLTPDLDAKIRERIWYVFSRNQIEFPFPVRHLLVENLERRLLPADNSAGAVIDSVELFEPLSPDERHAIANAAVRRMYAPGELILRRGDAGDSMFVVRRGKVEIRLTASNGDHQRVAVLEPGGFFGEMGLLTGEPRSADVNAVDEVEVLEIRKAALQQLLQENAGLAAALCERVEHRQAQLSDLTRSSTALPVEMQKDSILRRVQRFFGLN